MVMCAVPGMIRIRLLAMPAAICCCQLNGVTRSDRQRSVALDTRCAHDRPNRSVAQCQAL